MRVGFGYDIHRLIAGRRLVMGGVEIPSPVGLEGHSDADVVLHALMDAMLGAAGLGDIGTHFPPTDEHYREISSLELLRQVRHKLASVGLTLVNADTVIIAERPKLGPYREVMRSRIAEVLDVPLELISLKASTNEGVGPEGRGEAISARAVVLVE